MLRLAAAIGAVFLLALPLSPLAAPPANDFLIVPGSRVGPVRADATEAGLIARFGKARAKPVFVSIGEGLGCRGTEVDFGDNASLDIIWRDGKARAGVERIYVTGPRWRTREGVRRGISLRELERLNGRPFRLAGFEWDYSGTVTSWAGGLLESMVNRKAGTGVVLRPEPSSEAMKKLKFKQLMEVFGDSPMPSSHKYMRILNPTAYALIVAFGGACEEVDITGNPKP